MTGSPPARTGPSSPAQGLFILAMDHRDPFGRTLFGVHGTPNARQLAGMRSAKELIFTGARQATRTHHRPRPADGARSTVRAAVDPDFAEARSAGVLLWRSLVDEQALPPDVARPGAWEPSRELSPVLTGWLPTWCPGPQAENKRSGAAVSTWSGTTRSSATCCVTWACWTVRPSAAAWLQERCPAGP